MNALAPWSEDMEPAPVTAPELLPILSELARLETAFHWPESGTSRTDLEKMTTEDFWETGASGRRYSREFVLNALEKRLSSPHSDVWNTRGFQCRKLAQDLYLLTYTLLQEFQGKERLTQRSTIWQHASDGWKIVYHQGTVVQDFSTPTSPAPPRNPAPTAGRA